MPRKLKLYITAVVTLSAVALVVATRLFPPESRIALTFAVGNIPGVTVAAGSRPSSKSSPVSPSGLS